MGGAACAIPHLAIMANETIPTNPAKLPAFDAKLRECFTQTDIVHGIEDAGKTDAACLILQKTTWSAADRSALVDMLDALYD
jgi:hypothetical protein